MALDPSNVPSELAPLLPWAEEWGIGDDVYRNDKVVSASNSQLEALVRSIDGIRDEDLIGWLAGPASYDPKPSAEYIAITCLTMAIDYAEAILRKRQNAAV